MTTLEATHRASFIRSIVERPDDVQTRLIYADWLEGYGDEADQQRAEFVRVQCELSRMGPRPGGFGNVWQAAGRWQQKRDMMKAREKELWFKDEARPQLPRFVPEVMMGYTETDVPHKRSYCHCRRGMIERIECTQADWIAHGPAIVLSNPIRQVRLTDREPLHYLVLGHEECQWWLSNPLSSRRDNCEVDEFFHYLKNAQPKVAWADYATTDLAHADLSSACILYARTEAGLPEWRETK